MTKFQEFSLRPQGQPWPGLNTRGGRLDDGRGWLEDGSKNAIINEADVLQKRKGLVRGLEEAFDGVVCGLFAYTDNCGREWLLVADEGSINIRQPFNIPTFTQSDAYPFDSFSVDGAPNAQNWRNTAGYTQTLDQLILVSPTAAFSPAIRLPASSFMRWFKEASNKSYQVRVQYSFDATVASVQHVAISIKGQGDLSAGALLQADLIFTAGALEVEISHRRSDLTVRRLVISPVTDTSGFFTLTYDEPTRLVSATFGTTVISAPADSITTVDDADLGQISSIGMGFPAGLQPNPKILVVDGGPV